MTRLLPDDQVVTAYRELRERMCDLWMTLSDVDAISNAASDARSSVPWSTVSLQ